MDFTIQKQIKEIVIYKMYSIIALSITILHQLYKIKEAISI